MFFYLSFLRPPPQRTSLSGSVMMTPQIANDLRTELFSGSQDIYYAWTVESSTHTAKSSYPQITRPQKLTNWKQECAYKEIPVSLPPGAREGQTSRLVLTTRPQSNAHIVNLASPVLGEASFPVLSVPMLFSARYGKSVEKQEQVERIYRIPINTQEQVFMTVREQTSFDLDKKIWDSGVGLSSWIISLANEELNQASPPNLQRLKDNLLLKEARNVIELGAGTGIVSLTLGALRSSGQCMEGGCIIATDLPSAMPLLEHNISENERLFNSSHTKPRAMILDWDDGDLPEEASRQGAFHVIVMADVTYNTASFPSLIRTLNKLITDERSNTSVDPPMILLGYKERDPAERLLWDMAREIGIHFDKVGEKPGAGGEPVEIWIGSWA